jgi:hypothetical protein
LLIWRTLVLRCDSGGTSSYSSADRHQYDDDDDDDDNNNSKRYKFPCAQLIKHCAMKTKGVNGGITPPFLTSTLDGGELSAPLPGLFTPGERAPNTHWIGGEVGPRAGLDTMEKRKILPCKENKPG